MHRHAQIQFDMAAEFLKLDPGLRQISVCRARVLEVAIPGKARQRAGEGVSRGSASSTILRAVRRPAACAFT